MLCYGDVSALKGETLGIHKEFTWFPASTGKKYVVSLL